MLQINLKMPPAPLGEPFVKYERRAGIDYQVYPCVMLVEGVHQGVDSEPVYYSPSVLSESAPAWNNLPVTIGHPVNKMGEHVLCNTDGTIRQQWQVGFIFNARMEDGKLKADIYLDIRKVPKELLSYLQQGGELQVSTGMLAAMDDIAGDWQEEEYIGQITAIVPDHLALLPNSNGACNWDDGCGVRFNKSHLLLKEETDMADNTEERCCPERVMALIANESTPFGEDDTEWLEKLNEEQLGNIEKMLPKEEPVVEPEPEVEPVAEVEVTLESYLEAAPAEIRAVLNEGLRVMDEKRQGLIDKILAHNAEAFTAEQLKGMETATLNGMVALIPEEKKSSFKGANPQNSVVLSAEEEVEPYIPVTLSDVLGKDK